MSMRVRIDTGIYRRGHKIELYACIHGKPHTKMVEFTGLKALRNERELWIKGIKCVAEIARRTGIGAEFVGITVRQTLDELVKRGQMFCRAGRYSFDAEDRAGYAAPIARLLDEYADRPIADLTAPVLNDHLHRRRAGTGAGGRKHGAMDKTIAKSLFALRRIVRLATVGDSKAGRPPLISLEAAPLIAPYRGIHFKSAADDISTRNDDDRAYVPLAIRRLIHDKSLVLARAGQPIYYEIAWSTITGTRRKEIMLQRVELVDFVMRILNLRPSEQKSKYWARVVMVRPIELRYRRVLLFDDLKQIIIECAEAYGYKVELRRDGTPFIDGSGRLFQADANTPSGKLTDLFDSFFAGEIQPELSAMVARGEIEEKHNRRYTQKAIRCSVETDLYRQCQIHSLSEIELAEHMGHTVTVMRSLYLKSDGGYFSHAAALSPFVVERQIISLLDRKNIGHAVVCDKIAAGK